MRFLIFPKFYILIEIWMAECLWSVVHEFLFFMICTQDFSGKKRLEIQSYIFVFFYMYFLWNICNSNLIQDNIVFMPRGKVFHTNSNNKKRLRYIIHVFRDNSSQRAHETFAVEGMPFPIDIKLFFFFSFSNTCLYFKFFLWFQLKIVQTKREKL